MKKKLFFLNVVIKISKCITIPHPKWRGISILNNIKPMSSGINQQLVNLLEALLS